MSIGLSTYMIIGKLLSTRAETWGSLPFSGFVRKYPG